MTRNAIMTVTRMTDKGPKVSYIAANIFQIAKPAIRKSI